MGMHGCIPVDGHENGYKGGAGGDKRCRVDMPLDTDAAYFGNKTETWAREALTLLSNTVQGQGQGPRGVRPQSLLEKRTLWSRAVRPQSLLEKRTLEQSGAPAILAREAHSGAEQLGMEDHAFR